MSSDSSKKADENMVDFAVVTPHAQGGTLSDFFDYLKRTKQPCDISTDRTQVWFYGAAGELIRIPLECLEPVEPARLQDLLRQRGVWVVSYLLDGDESHPPNCFDYVCRDSTYSIEKLHAYARRDIRRGLRSFTVRLCTWEELEEKGFAAEADTAARHGYAAPLPEGLKRKISQQRGSPFFEIWGAWDGDDLTAWLQLAKIGNWATIDVVRSCTKSLRLCPNNALLYAVTRRILVEEKREYISYGLSSSQVSVDQLSMHKYKIRMGYEALPLHRVFVVHPLLRPLLTPRAVSWMWEKAAALIPKSKTLRKVAGMSKLLSGREKKALAWAEDKA
ncbi:MAG: hypothetical protein ACYSSO_04025 [Planctomycetota bacterium]|jgi:hypothetical protein